MLTILVDPSEQFSRLERAKTTPLGTHTFIPNTNSTPLSLGGKENKNRDQQSLHGL